MIDVENLTRRFGKLSAVEGLTFHVRLVVGLLVRASEFEPSSFGYLCVRTGLPAHTMNHMNGDGRRDKGRIP
jgi:hypothetical protein